MYSMENDISNYCIVRIYIYNYIRYNCIVFIIYIYIRYNGFLRSVAVSGD